jgi:hypothetical protein
MIFSVCLYTKIMPKSFLCREIVEFLAQHGRKMSLFRGQISFDAKQTNPYVMCAIGWDLVLSDRTNGCPHDHPSRPSGLEIGTSSLGTYFA